MHLTQDVVRWCADECERQQCGEMSVHRMTQAWAYVFSNQLLPSLLVMLNAGLIVEPTRGHVRTTPASFRNLSVALDPAHVPRPCAGCSKPSTPTP